MMSLKQIYTYMKRLTRVIVGKKNGEIVEHNKIKILSFDIGEGSENDYAKDIIVHKDRVREEKDTF